MSKRHCWNCIEYWNCEEAFAMVSKKFPIKKCEYHEYRSEYNIAMAMDSIFNSFDGVWF